MHLLVLTLLGAGLLPAADPPEAPYGCLYQPAYSLDEKPRPPAEPYEPQPGDLLFFDDHAWSWQICFYMAGAHRPMHAGIVVRLPDGGLAALEAGYNDTMWIETIPLAGRLPKFKGAIWVRRRAEPLTEEQSAKLTEFALAATKRLFALHRLIGQLTPFRSRGPIKTFFLGKPHGLRCCFFCSECVMEGCVYAELLDPKTTRPAATYPRDMFFDRSPNIYLNKHLKLAPDWKLPQLWTQQ